ncbi:hypothetical protein [Iamia sp.]|uniref:hypothetical protein n=1 Tax=Iamia sp. TaxID=2722710 RepID=UPI002BC3DE86|nr:hypothetical protein [Iamia sp.]HXH59578.1 hypothetical protein [Iamia sp.]
MDPVILAGARRHGISDDDMLHAHRHPIRVFLVDGFTMIVGGDQSGQFLEVGVATSDEGIEFIVHAMTARPKYLR